MATRLAVQLEYYRRNFRVFAIDQLRIQPVDDTVPVGIDPVAAAAYDGMRREKGIVPFYLTDGQQLLDAKVERQLRERGFVRGVALKGRQAGFSTYGQARCAWKAMLNTNYSTLLIANDEDSTQKIFKKAHLMYECLSDGLRPMIRYMNKQSLAFENPDREKRPANPGLRSYMDFQTAKNRNAGTGTTRQGLHLSEMAKYSPEYIQFLKSSLMPTVHSIPGSMIFVESTAYYGGDHFREMCDQAMHKASIYFFHFHPWWLERHNRIPLLRGEKFKLDAEEKRMQKLAQRGQPEIEVPPYMITDEQFNWRRQRVQELGDLTAQEYPECPEAAWVNLEITVFNRDILHEMEADIRKPLRFCELRPGPPYLVTVRGSESNVHESEEYLAVWQEPQKGVQYDIGADVGAGLEDGDWSVAEVFRRDTHEQVAEYHKHTGVMDYGDDLYWLGWYYNQAHLVLEINGPGYGTHSRLQKMCYPNLYIWRHRERSTPTLSTYSGWKTSPTSKPLLVATGQDLFLHRKMRVHSSVLIRQMRDFVRTGEDSYQAFTGHDDACMAMLLAIQGGEDESFGAPKPAAPLDAQPIVLPAFSDTRDFGRNDDTGLRTLLRDLRG